MIGTLTNEEMDELLKTNVLGRIGCNDGKRTYVVPINYAYDGKSVIAHSVPGMKISIMQLNPQVCFEVDEMKSFTKWKSVIAWGEYHELTNERDRYAAMKLFIDRMIQVKVSKTAVLPAMGEARVHLRSPGTLKPVIFRIIITEKSGRFEDE